jgi:hypothetical protein
MTFPADTLELLLPSPPRVCHKAPFHRLPLEFGFKMADPDSIRRDNTQQDALTSSAVLVQKTSGACFRRMRAFVDPTKADLEIAKLFNDCTDTAFTYR